MLIHMKVMEMINKNVSTDFEALKKHAMKDYWHMDEVNLFQISKTPIITFLYSALLVRQPGRGDK